MRAPDGPAGTVARSWLTKRKQPGKNCRDGKFATGAKLSDRATSRNPAAKSAPCVARRDGTALAWLMPGDRHGSGGQPDQTLSGEQRMTGVGISRTVRTVCAALAVLAALGTSAHATSRIKDLANIEGVRQNQLIGYGLVVGLNGTGDTLNNI